MNAPGTQDFVSTAPDATADDPLWYKDAVIYQLHVKAFFDANGDGVGDFRGLIEKLDYIQTLGVNAVWLLPFYPSPLKDDGYDVGDYHGVHEQYGTLVEFRQFVREAHRRGLRVITELVINHTSDQHPWFQAARRAPAGSSKRNFYVWSDSDRKHRDTRIICSDSETSNWAWDPVAKAFYWHRFYSHQPDLNFDNPSVVKAVIRAMRYWLDIGVDGFRLDAIPYLVEREGTSNENLPETHAVIKKIRAALDARYTGKLFLAEANQWPEDVREYFGEGDECHMAYHFPLMPRMYMAIAQEDRHPVVEILQQTPEIPESCQWAIFLRNHDELTLEMVTSRERDYMYRTYAADPRARINLGIRRRLAPLLENDSDRIRLMNGLLLSMPGSPIIYYGDEIGMGDNIYLGDRNGVRTPMQWSPDRNAGFSRADPQRLYLPPIMDAVYGSDAVNVEAQLREPNSLLNWMRRMLAVRKTSRAFGRGKLAFLKPGNRKILAYVREHGEEIVLCVVNFGRSAQPVELDLARYRGRVPVEMLGRTPFPPIGELPYLITLPMHGFYWFRLAAAGEVDAPSWHQERSSRDDLPVMVLFDGWTSFFRNRVVPWRIGLAVKTREQLEVEVLARHVEAQGWYGGKGEPVKRVNLADWAQWDAGRASCMLALVEIEGVSHKAACFLPLTLAWEEHEDERVRALGAASVAKVRRQAQTGVLADALADESFCRAVIEAIGAGEEIAAAQGKFRFVPTAAFAAVAGEDYGTLPVARPKTQSSNTVVTFGERLFLKCYRRVQPGVDPEFEVGRFLSDQAKFGSCASVAGALEYIAADGTPTTLSLLLAYVPNQGDGWSYAMEYLHRFFDQSRTAPGPQTPAAHGDFVALMQILGQRTGELHRALATGGSDASFAPEPVAPDEFAGWKARVRQEAATTLELLEGNLKQLVLPARDAANALLERRAALAARIEACPPVRGPLLKTRYHGNYDLGQVLVSKFDFLIVDFEGETALPFPERRRKHSPLRDVAAMVRSLDYVRWSALRSNAQTAEEHERLAAMTAVWHDASRAAFLAGYDEATRGAGLFASFADARMLLELFELEKALQELRYEILNRPGWVEVPVQGIMALMSSERPD